MRSRVPAIPKPISEHFSASDALSPLLAKAQRLVALQRTLNSVAPTIAAQCRIANLRDGHVVIWTTNNATAAKLKLLVPRLTERFVSACADVKGVKIEVQFLMAATIGSVNRERDLTPPPSAPLEALARTLPDSPLRNAILSLASKGRRTTT